MCLHLSPLRGPLGIAPPRLIGPLRLELPPPPVLLSQPTTQTKPVPPPPPPKPPKPTPPGPQDLKKQIDGLLDQGNFDLPAYRTDDEVKSGATPKSRVFFSHVPGRDELGPSDHDAPQDMMTIDELTDILCAGLKFTTPNVKRSDVLAAVLQAYTNKVKEAEDKHWSVSVSMQYAPTYFFWANQSLPSPWQNGWQLQAGGLTYRHHPQGRPGLEQSLTLQLSGASLGFDNADWFQNLLAVYQLAYVIPGPDFRFPGAPGLWSYLQGSIFAQVAAGVGSPGENKLYLGFMTQEAVGGQLALNIGHVMIVVNDQIVYSYLSPTSAANSKYFSGVGNQFGVGVGVSW